MIPRVLVESRVNLANRVDDPFVGLDWAQMGSVAVGAGIMSLLTAIVATGIGDKGTAQLLKENR